MPKVTFTLMPGIFNQLNIGLILGMENLIKTIVAGTIAKAAKNDLRPENVGITWIQALRVIGNAEVDVEIEFSAGEDGADLTNGDMIVVCRKLKAFVTTALYNSGVFPNGMSISVWPKPVINGSFTMTTVGEAAMWVDEILIEDKGREIGIYLRYPAHMSLPKHEVHAKLKWVGATIAVSTTIFKPADFDDQLNHGCYIPFYSSEPFEPGEYIIEVTCGEMSLNVVPVTIPENN